jgi:hypothetical protein
LGLVVEAAGEEGEREIELIRTSRSKGSAVMMISQSPDDFDGDEENFLENVVGLCLRTNAKPSSLKAMFGQSIDLAGMEKCVGVTRLAGESARFVRIGGVIHSSECERRMTPYALRCRLTTRPRNM